MELSFLAKSDELVAVPGTASYAGQLARYVGREWEDARHAYVASKEPFRVDSESDDGRRLSRLMRRDNSLLPGDLATADYFGVKFVACQNTEGEWVPAATGTREVRAAKKGND